jgi:hypothetical protein
VILSAPIGSVVHDRAAVTGTAAGGTPTGNVTFTVYLGNTTCTGAGTPAGTVSLVVVWRFRATYVATVPVGGLSYKGDYNGSVTPTTPRPVTVSR